MTRFLNPRLALLVFSLSALFQNVANAQIWQEAPNLKHKQLTVGVFPMVTFKNSTFELFMNGMYGVTSQWQAEILAGVGTGSSLFGAQAKHHFHSNEVFDLAFSAGFHFQQNFTAVGSLIFSHTFRKFSFYLSPLMNLTFVGNGNLFSLGFIPGFSTFMTSNMKLYGELILNGTNYYDAISLGIRFYF